MIEAQLNVFDMVVISIMLLSCVFAFFRGFVREILSLGAWLGAGIITVYYFPDVAEWLAPHFKSPMFAAGAGTLLLYVSSLIAFSMINSIIMKFLKSGADVGILDNLFGLAFGALRGALIISLGYFLLMFAVSEKKLPVWLEKAATRGIAEKGALMLANAAPGYLKELADFQKKATGAIEEKTDEEKEEDTKIIRHEEEEKPKPSKLDKIFDDIRAKSKEHK